jgi:rhodanese-related sulfurtransferase
MATTIGREEVRRLAASGAQLVDVLERDSYRWAHLPGAVNIPAWDLTEAQAATELSRGGPVVVYCYDMQ